MTVRPRPVALVLAAAVLTGAAAAAEPADPDFLEQYAATHRFRLGKPTSIRPTPDGKSVLFLRSGPRDFARKLYELELAGGEERLLLDAGTLLGGSDEELTDEEKARRERMRLVASGIATYRLSRDGDRILVPLSGRLFVLEREGGAIRELESDAGYAIDPQLSPDAARVACVRDGDLYVIDIESGEERRLTRRAGAHLSNGLAEFVAQEEMRRPHGFWWSPDSSRIAYQETDTTGVETLSIMDATRPERPPRGSPYPRPGKQNAAVRLGIVSIDGGPTIWVRWDRRRHEYLASVKWKKNAPLTVLLQNRRQTESRLLAVDPADGSTSTLLVERDDDWVEIDQTVPLWLPDGSAFLWTTERRGALQVELRGADGELRKVVTPPDLGMQGLVAYRPQRNDIVLRASRNPTETHLYSLPLEDGRPRRISRETGIHAASFNRPGTTWVHAADTLAGEEWWEVVGPDGPTGKRIRSLAESAGFRPNLELTTVGSKPELHAALIRPRDFDPQKTYPVVVHVYGGPTSLMVRADPGRYLLGQWIADHGYVVVAVDGRGTPHRGRAWQRAVKNDLIRLPLEDQARALRLLGERYGELDLSRVGIYGWSFGGYVSALAVMLRGDVFHAGVAGAPVVDWRDYDTHYTERYMDLPETNPEGYEATSALTHVDRLSRPLLIIHGTADDNVYFMHSLKLADALFRAGKPFEFLPLTGFTHMVPDPLVTERLYTRIVGFLDRHLRSASASDHPEQP